MRARLTVLYEQKEAARARAEWKARGVVMGEKFPRPILKAELT
jgi:hypothetical protein